MSGRLSCGPSFLSLEVGGVGRSRQWRSGRDGEKDKDGERGTGRVHDNYKSKL